MAGRLDGKVVIVAGAASRGEGVGTGKAMAVLAAREGAKVMLVNRSAERAEALRREIAEEGGDAAVFAGDMSVAKDAAAMVAATEARYGRLDVLCNNIGGGGVPGAVAEIAEAGWDKGMAINLKTAMLVTRAAIPALQRAGGGVILNVSSIVGARGLTTDTGAVAYATAKAGLHGFTMSIAADYAGDGIRCNCLVVGSIYTPMVAHQGDEARQRRIAMVLLKTEGTGWDIGWGMVYLASNEARWITGAFLPIDGGLLAIHDWPR